MKIFIYMPNWLGDAAMALGALNLLKAHFKDANFVLYGSPSAMALVQGYGLCINQNKHRLAQFLSLRKERFDLAINFKGSMSSRILCWLLAAKKLVLFKQFKNESAHQVYKYAKILAPLGVDISNINPRSPAKFRFIKSKVSNFAKSKKSVQKLFAADIKPTEASVNLRNYFKQLKPRGFLGIAPGASYGSAKCYEDFSALALCLKPYFKELVIFGTKAESASASRLQNELRSHFKVHNLCDKTSIKRLSLALSSCSLVLANDSGIMHLCAMNGAKVASVFGPTNVDITAAYSKNALIFSTLADCSPCNKRQCPLKHHNCMKLCDAKAVAKEIVKEFKLKEL